MERRDNYAIQAAQAKARFLTYDQAAIIRKFGLKFDDEYLYTTLLTQPYRVSRTTGDLEKAENGAWTGAGTHAEVLTIFDLLCDAREDRQLSGQFKTMQNFGHQFHQSLLEDQRDALAEAFDRDPERFHRACLGLLGVALPYADIAYRVELFDKLPIAIHFWHGDDEFAPQLRFFWDANSLQYIRYETMYYAVNLLRKRLASS